MKAKIITLLLACVLCFSLAACGESGGAQSVLESTEAIEAAAEEEEEIVLPDAVVNISEEDDKALTGILTEDTYTNPYFGLVIRKPEGGMIKSLMDESELVPFSKTFTDGMGGIYILANDDDGNVSTAIQALSEKEEGKTEEELIQEQIDLEKSINETAEIDSEVTMETLSIAGAEHPALIEVSSDEEGTTKYAVVYILKGDFKCNISVYAPQEKFDGMLGLIEKAN